MGVRAPYYPPPLTHATVFESIREALRELWSSSSTPDERRAALAQMRETLVRARVGIEELEIAISASRVKLAGERRELETMLRRKTLAASISDLETVALAERYERQHAERVAVLERKLGAQEAELLLVQQEMAEMTAEFKAASAGAGSSPLGAGKTERDAAAEADAAAGSAEALRQELDAMGRHQGRAARDASAEERLAELKRRMGK